MKTHMRNLLLLFLLSMTILTLSACGGGGGSNGDAAAGGDAGGEVLADMDGYLATLPNWEEFTPLLDDFDAPLGEPTQEEETVGDKVYNCTSTNYSMTRTPDKIVTLNPDVEVLWPGALLQGSGYVGGIGSLDELPIRQRSPMTISIDLLTEGNTATVDSPNLASVNQAVGSLIQAASDAGHRAGSKIFFNQVDYHSLAEASLNAGFSANYYDVTVKANLEASASAEQSTVMAVYTQQMFTVSVELPQTPGTFFSNELTEDILQEQTDLNRIGPNNLPVFVSSITYGRTVVFSMTATATHAEIRAALDVAAAGQGAELSDEQKLLLERSEIKLVAIGGDATNAASVIRSGNFSNYFDADADLTTAKPISYTIRNLADNSTALVSETTEYNLRECAAADIPVTGSEYTIEIADVQWAEQSPRICPPVVHTLVSSQFWVEDSENITQAVNEIGGGLLTNVGDRKKFPTSTMNPTNPVKVKLHYDGRDEVKIYGDIWTVYPQHFDWSSGIRFKHQIPTGYLGANRWSSIPKCSRFLLRYRVTRTGDLYD